MIYRIPYVPEAYELRFTSYHSEVEAVALRDDPVTEGCFAEPLGLLEERAAAGPAMKDEDIYAEGYERGLSIHLLRLGRRAVFYTYETGSRDGLRILGFCGSRATQAHVPNIESRLRDVP